MNSRSTTTARADLGLLTLLSASVLIVHFYVGDGYGFHRDELQFLDDARHLDWGFVAYPPLTSFCGRLAIALFGISPQVLRLPAAWINMLTLVLAGLTARVLGGGRAAQVTTLVAMLPVALAFSSVLQYNTFDLVAWGLVAYFTSRVLQSGDERNWVGVGLAIGIGVLSKYSIAFPVVSLAVALLTLPSQRRHLRSKWLWLGLLLALVIAAPNLIWLIRHDFITLRMESFIHARDVRLGRAKGYLTDQLKFTMLGLLIATAGLVWLLRSSRFRLLSAFWIGPFVLFAIVRGRGYYLLPGYTVLYAAGAVALEQMLSRCNRRVRLGARSVVIAGLLAESAAVCWAYLPVWRVGSAGWHWQMSHNRDLEDEIGWPELVAQVAAVRDTLPLSERGRLAVLANNYGEAGAVALYGPRYGLPVPISSTNTFHLRGWGPYEPVTVIVMGGDLQDQLRNFETCTTAAPVQIPYAVRNEESEDHPSLLVCRHLRGKWPEIWAKSQVFG